MGFAEQWIALIMKCVTTVRYRVKVNGDLSQSLIPYAGGGGDAATSSYCVLKERGTRWFFIAGVKA